MGFARRYLLVSYMLRNSLRPVITVLSINVGYLIGGTVIVEQIFSVPGVGSLLIGSITTRDYAIIQLATLLFAILVVLANLPPICSTASSTRGWRCDRRRQRTARPAWRRGPALAGADATHAGFMVHGLGLIGFALFVIAALGAPLLTPYDPVTLDLLSVLQPPSAAHPFGTDQLGRDILYPGHLRRAHRSPDRRHRRRHPAGDRRARRARRRILRRLDRFGHQAASSMSSLPSRSWCLSSPSSPCSGPGS